MHDAAKRVRIRYFALLREERGLTEEELETDSLTVQQLFDQLNEKHKFSLGTRQLNVAVNEEFKSWDTALQNGDLVVFIPPVAGG